MTTRREVCEMLRAVLEAMRPTPAETTAHGLGVYVVTEGCLHRGIEKTDRLATEQSAQAVEKPAPAQESEPSRPVYSACPDCDLTHRSDGSCTCRCHKKGSEGRDQTCETEPSRAGVDAPASGTDSITPSRAAKGQSLPSASTRSADCADGGDSGSDAVSTGKPSPQSNPALAALDRAMGELRATTEWRGSGHAAMTNEAIATVLTAYDAWREAAKMEGPRFHTGDQVMRHYGADQPAPRDDEGAR